jgi:hypothetical protein
MRAGSLARLTGMRAIPGRAEGWSAARRAGLVAARVQHYQQRRTEVRPERRAQLMLLANLEIGFHEQTRLQPEIQRLWSAPGTVDDLKQRLGLASAFLRPSAAMAFPARRFAREVTRQIVSKRLWCCGCPTACCRWA